MSRNTNASEAMAAALALFEANGVTITDEMREAAANAQQNEMRFAAVEIFNRKVLDTDTTEVWTDLAFDLASNMSEGLISETVSRGRGRVVENMFRVETPHGSLKVSLTRTLDTDDK